LPGRGRTRRADRHGGPSAGRTRAPARDRNLGAAGAFAHAVPLRRGHGDVVDRDVIGTPGEIA
jgi:hypothetical protein